MDGNTRVPKIDFSGLKPERPGGEQWNAVREQVMAALQAYSCFEAVYDRVTPELWSALFEKATPELFALPLDVKLKNTSDKPYHGYIGQFAGYDYESLIIDDATNLKAADAFVSLMWPNQGNPSFRETVYSFAKVLSELDKMTRRMVLEILGVEKHYESHVGSTQHSLRLSKYGAPNSEERANGLQAHTDMSMFSMVCQHKIQGLEVLTRDGNWITPSTTSITVMSGESFWAWSNGRIEPCWHRVMVSGNETRYSAIFGSYPKDGYMVEAPAELIDEEHPLQFKPFEYVGYLGFRFNGAGKNYKYALKAYCGNNGGGGEEVEALA